MLKDGGMSLIRLIVSLPMIVRILFPNAYVQAEFQCGEAQIEGKGGGWEEKAGATQLDISSWILLINGKKWWDSNKKSRPIRKS